MFIFGRGHLPYFAPFGAPGGGNSSQSSQAGNRGSVPEAGNTNTNNNGNGNNNGNNGNNGNNNASGNGDGNNNGGFDLSSVNLWEPPKAENGNSGNTQNNNSNGNGNNNNNSNANSQSAFDNYVNGLKWDFKLSQEAVQKFISQGDVAGLQNAIQENNRALYRSVTQDVAKMVQGAVKSAVASAVSEAKGAFQTDKAVSLLEERMPMAKNPNVKPIANAIMAQFLKRGEDLDTAAESTKAFFGALRGAKSEEFGLPKDPPRGSAGNNRSIGAAPGSDDELMDWLSFSQSG